MTGSFGLVPEDDDLAHYGDEIRAAQKVEARSLNELTGIIPDLDEATYFGHHALSSTGARKILDSPARFRYAVDHPQAPKAAFDLGHAVHSKVLGTGSPIVVLDFDSFRTKAAQEARDEAYAAGKVPVLAKDTAQSDAMAEAVLAHPTARTLFEQDGQAEASVFGTDPETGVEVRARFDWLAPINVDLKTTGKSAAKPEFEKSVVSFGYETQQVHYEDTLRFAGVDDRPFVFVVVETDAPHLVAVHQLDIVFREMGKTKARRARELFAECTASGIWPGHPEEVQLISPPVWAVYQHEEKYA